MRGPSTGATELRRGWLYSAALALLGVVALGALSAGAYVSALRWVDHTIEVRDRSYEWGGALRDAEVSAHAFVTGDRDVSLQAFEAALHVARERGDAVRLLILGDEVQERNVDACRRDAEGLADRLNEVVALTADGHRGEARDHMLDAIGAGEFEAVRQDLRLIREEEDRLLVERRAAATLRGWFALGAAAMLVLTAASLWWTAYRRDETNRALSAARAEEARARLEALARLSAALSEARTPKQVAEVVVELGTAATGADTCTFYALDEAGEGLDLLADRGVAPEIVELLRRITATTGNPETFATVKARTATWAESEEEYAALQPNLASRKEHRARSFWSVPLVAEDRPVGLLGAGYYAPRRFSESEREFIRTVADQCGQALVRATRMQREDEARQWLAAARARSEFLARAGEALAGTLDEEATLATVAQLAVPAIADWCAVSLVPPRGGPARQVAIAHVDPDKVAFARAIGERYPVDPAAPSGLPEVIRSGKSQLHTDVSQERLEAVARDAEHLGLLRELRLSSAILVPLRVRGRTSGAITFAQAESGRRYTEEDLAFAEDFARRAAMAIENALAHKEAEEARKKERWLRGEAELASQAKDDFLATVSHELRTPLNAILSWAVMLRARNPPESTERGLGIIERNARTQAKLIEDILDISGIISGKLALHLTPTNIAVAVAAAIETVTPAATAKDIAVAAELGEEGLTIAADADRFQQIVWNLLSNAVKFTPKGGRVAVQVRREGSDVFLRVSDNGDGIPSAMLPFIFERFRQADASTTRRYGGLGLGLAIVKQLVNAHGGSVQAESEGEGKGASFTVQLPARSVVAAIDRSARASTAADGAGGRDGPRLDGLRLLVIDDEPDAREVVGEVLRGRGAEVELAASAAEALERFAASRPDVIVSDIGMPGADGYSLIRKIRALPPDAGGRTPAVALTAYARSEDAQRAFVAGFQMHVAKPIEPARLAIAVANVGGLADRR